MEVRVNFAFRSLSSRRRESLHPLDRSFCVPQRGVYVVAKINIYFVAGN
jgi:hypothetical protein